MSFFRHSFRSCPHLFPQGNRPKDAQDVLRTYTWPSRRIEFAFFSSSDLIKSCFRALIKCYQCNVFGQFVFSIAHFTCGYLIIYPFNVSGMPGTWNTRFLISIMWRESVFFCLFAYIWIFLLMDKTEIVRCVLDWQTNQPFPDVLYGTSSRIFWFWTRGIFSSQTCLGVLYRVGDFSSRAGP